MRFTTRHINKKPKNGGNKPRDSFYLYNDEKRSADELSDLLKCSKSTFYRMLIKWQGDVQRMMDFKLGKIGFD